MEEWQEEDAVKEQCRCNTTEQERTGQEENTKNTSNVYSQLSGIEDVDFNDFIKEDFIPEGDG